MIPRILAAAVLVLAVTFAIAAAGEQAAAPAAEDAPPVTTGTPAAPSQDAPSLDAPIQASQGGAPSAVLSPSEEQATLAAIRAGGQTSVQALVEDLARAADDAARIDLQKRIQQAKFDTEVRFLEESARLARARGDEQTAVDAERVRVLILEPLVPAENAAPQSRQKGAAQAPTHPSGQEGGSK
jgi:hypothetical protein